MVARTKAWFCGRSLAGIAGSNPAGGIVACLLWVLRVLQVQVPASGWSLVQRSLTDWGVSDCDREASIMRMSWPTSDRCVIKKKESIIHELAHNKQECIAKSIRSVLCSKIRCSIPDNRKSLNNYAILPQFLPFMLMTVVRIVGNSLCRVIFTCLTYFNILKKPHIVTDGISCNFRNKQWPFD